MNHDRICVDLFSGLGGFSAAFRDRGWYVFTVDIEDRFEATQIENIMDIESRHLPHRADVVLMSPPCNCFSIASVSSHWNKDKTPKDSAKQAIGYVEKSLWLKDQLNPKFWILENPRGMLKNVFGEPVLKFYQAMFGTSGQKATHFWGNMPKSFIDYVTEQQELQFFDWEPAPRGSKTGTQGLKDSALRAKIPYELSLKLCKAIETEMNNCYKQTEEVTSCKK